MYIEMFALNDSCVANGERFNAKPRSPSLRTGAFNWDNPWDNSPEGSKAEFLAKRYQSKGLRFSAPVLRTRGRRFEPSQARHLSLLF